MYIYIYIYTYTHEKRGQSLHFPIANRRKRGKNRHLAVGLDEVAALLHRENPENNPADCQWPDECSGRQPAPWERIAKQLGNECNKPWRCTAWEWHSCLSPSCTESPVHEQAVENYNAYVAYLGGGAAGGEARGPI